MKLTPAPFALMIATTLLLSGCGGMKWGSSKPDPLPASPTSPVEGQPLEPLDLKPGDSASKKTTDGDGEADDPNTPETETPSGPPSEPPQAASLKVGRTDLLGGWKLRTPDESCQLFMTLTTWEGGYRATTKGCSSDTLKSISAWDLVEKQIQLKDSSRAAVAYLYPVAVERFEGRTASKNETISFGR